MLIQIFCQVNQTNKLIIWYQHCHPVVVGEVAFERSRCSLHIQPDLSIRKQKISHILSLGKQPGFNPLLVYWTPYQHIAACQKHFSCFSLITVCGIFSATKHIFLLLLNVIINRKSNTEFYGPFDIAKK